MAHLEQKLKTIDIFAIVAGVMISSGIFVLPGIAYRQAGPAVVISYLIAAVIYIPAIVSIVELATAMPRAGGTYFVLDRSLGTVAGTVGGLAGWLALSLKGAFALVGIGALVQFFFPDFSEIWIKNFAALFCLMFIVVNLFSVDVAGRFQVILVMALIAILVLYSFRGSFSIDYSRFSPFTPHGAIPVLSTAGMVFMAFIGVTKATSVGEETVEPSRTMPRGIFTAYGVTVALYLLAVFVTVGIVPGEELKNTLTPMGLGAKIISGKTGVLLVNIGALLAFATTANAGIMAASRDMLALSRDGHLPSIFSKIDHRYNSPRIAILATGAFMILSIYLLKLEDLIKTGSCLQITLMIMVMLSVIVMRESKIYSYQPTFKSPLYPYMHIAGIISFIIILSEIGLSAVSLAMAFLLAGLFWFWIYTRIQVKRKPALVYMAERLATGRHPVSSRHTKHRPVIAAGGLKKELTSIVAHRDSVRADSFDQLIDGAIYMDLHWHMPVTGLFRKAAASLSREIPLEKEEIYNRLMDEESRSSSAVRPGLAVSCALFDEEMPLSMIVIRSISGVEFSPIKPPVYCAFILAGSRYDRDKAMKAVFAICQITQWKDFDKNWLKAADEEEIKDLLKHGRRRRIYDVYCRFETEGEEGEPEAEPSENQLLRFIEGEKLKERDLYGLPLMKGFDGSFFIAGDYSPDPKTNSPGE